MQKSIFEELERVQEQVEYECFEGDVFATTSIYREICLIIAEVNILPANANIRIAKEEMPVSLVQEVYGSLKNEHITSVVDKYKKITYPIFNKKAYLRTALYNAAFELDADAVNEYAYTNPSYAQSKTIQFYHDIHKNR